MKKTIAILFFILCILACENEDSSPIPNVYVRFTIDLDAPEYFNLDAGTSSDTIKDKGYAGIILYCVIRDEHYYAYDLCCPIHYEDNEQLILDGAAAMCPTDSIYFNLSTNDLTILKSYSTSIYGRTMQIVNNNY